MMKVISQNLNSSAISWVAWDPEFDIMYLRFPTGSCWIYHDVTYETYHSLVTANSAGNFFNKNIRNSSHYHAQRVFEGKREFSRAGAQ
jgi:hypothetical protein